MAAALARGVARTGAEPDALPVADGGDGTLEVLLAAAGGQEREVPVRDALGRDILATFGLLGDGTTAVVEMASASGLALIAPAERDAEAASTYGTGELIAAAAEAGAERIVVGAGGSATTDGGAGAILAIDAAGGLSGRLLTVLCDVDVPFELAAEVFGPQKGADPETVGRLTARLHRQAASLARDPRGIARTGAAGGLAGGLWAHFAADLVGGADWVLDAIGFDDRAAGVAAVITGEGRLDEQTLAGKAVAAVARRARARRVPIVLVAGSVALPPDRIAALGASAVHTATTTAELEAAGAKIAAAVLTGEL